MASTSPRLPSESPESPRRRGQVLGSLMQQGGAYRTNEVYATSDFQQSSQAQRPSPDSNMSMNIGGPVQQLPLEHSSYGGRKRSLPTNQIDSLMQENAQLRKDLEALQLEQQQVNDACDSMLTKVIETEELLTESQAALAAKDDELAKLRDQLAKSSSAAAYDVPVALKPARGRTLSEEQTELRDLHLKCNRLVKEAERKDEQLRQAQEQIQSLHMTSSRSPTNQHPNAQAQHQEIMTLKHQLSEWREAYGKLDYSCSQWRAQAESLQAAQSQAAQPRIDEQVLRRMESEHKAELAAIHNMCNFYKQNSETLSKNNKSIVDEKLSLQKSLSEMNREITQQKSLINALQVQMR